MLDQGRAAFHPIAVVAIQHTVDVADFRMMDMAAHHAVEATTASFMRHRHLEVRNEIDRFLDLVFEVSRQRPVLQPPARTPAVEVTVELERQFVEPVAHMGQPLGALDHTVKQVAMHHPQALAGGRDVHCFFPNFDAAKGMAGEGPGKFVVVARYIDNMAALAGTAQKLLHHVVVALRPEPAAAQLPAVHDVPHQVQSVTGVLLQKIQQSIGLETWCTNVQV